MSIPDFKNIQDYVNYFKSNPGISIIIILLFLMLAIMFIKYKKVDKWLLNIKIELMQYIKDNVEYIKSDISHIRECTQVYVDGAPEIKEFLKERVIMRQERKPKRNKIKESSSGGNIEAGFE